MPPSPPRLQSRGRQPIPFCCNHRTRLLGLLVCFPLAFMLITSFWVRGVPRLRPDDLHLLHPAHSGAEAGAGGRGGAHGSASSSSSRAEWSSVRRLISSDSWQEQQQQQQQQQLGGNGGGGGAVERPWQQPERGPPGAAAPCVWLYTLVGADYEGSSVLLLHWLRHYLVTLGFPANRLLVVVNTNSSSEEARGELARVEGVLREWGVGHTLWTGRYSSDAHLKVKLQVLAGAVHDVEDWIVIADSDEFHSYAGGSTISELLHAAEGAGNNWVLGQMVDRVSPNGELAQIQASPSLFEQFPYNCHVVRHVSRGSVWKVVAAKAYWRTNTGNHYVVPPDSAAQYFGGAEPGFKNPRGGWFGAENLWPYTPYSQHFDRYQYSGTKRDPSLWHLSQYPALVPVYHFKWRQGVLQSAADRYEYYRGNATQPGGLPRYKHYNESRNIVQALSAGRIDLKRVRTWTDAMRPKRDGLSRQSGDDEGLWLRAAGGQVPAEQARYTCERRS